MHVFRALLSMLHLKDSLLRGSKTHVIDFDKPHAWIFHSERRSYVKTVYEHYISQISSIPKINDILKLSCIKFGSNAALTYRLGMTAEMLSL